MKRFLFMMLAIAVFAGCSKEESTVLSEGDKITRSIGKINTPLMAVLKSVEFWEESKAFAYTEPDGKGEELALFDASVEGVDLGDGWRGWMPFELLTFSDDQLVKYIPMTKLVRRYHYYDFDITKFEDNTLTFTRNDEEYYLKVLAYNENSIWIETNCYDVDKNYQNKYGRADSYPYVRILYNALPPKSYPLDGWLSEEEITPYKIEYPVKLPDNFFEIAEGTPIWKQDFGYSLVYDKDKLLFDNENLVVYKGLGVKKYNIYRGSSTRYYWYKFVNGIFYQISYYYVNRDLLSYPHLSIKKCETPDKYLLGITDSNQIIISEQDYNRLIVNPYYNNSKDYKEIPCYYISEGTEADIEMIEQLYNDPDVQKVYSNF